MVFFGWAAAVAITTVLVCYDRCLLLPSLFSHRKLKEKNKNVLCGAHFSLAQTSGALLSPCYRPNTQAAAHFLVTDVTIDWHPGRCGEKTTKRTNKMHLIVAVGSKRSIDDDEPVLCVSLMQSFDMYYTIIIIHHSFRWAIYGFRSNHLSASIDNGHHVPPHTTTTDDDDDDRHRLVSSVIVSYVVQRCLAFATPKTKPIDKRNGDKDQMHKHPMLWRRCRRQLSLKRSLLRCCARNETISIENRVYASELTKSINISLCVSGWVAIETHDTHSRGLKQGGEEQKKKKLCAVHTGVEYGCAVNRIPSAPNCSMSNASNPFNCGLLPRSFRNSSLSVNALISLLSMKYTLAAPFSRNWRILFNSLCRCCGLTTPMASKSGSPTCLQISKSS